MDRRGTDLGPWRDHPWATPAAVMTETLSTMRVLGRGGGRLRRRTCGRGCLAQRDELQGRIHGPAHQRPQRALVLATVGHRGEHVFVNLRGGSDGNLRTKRDPGGRFRGSHGAARNRPPRAATDLARALRTPPPGWPRARARESERGSGRQYAEKAPNPRSPALIKKTFILP